MINLLPQSEKKKLRKEFRLRAAALALGALFALEAFAFVTLIPSYLIVDASTSALTAQLAEKRGASTPGGEATQNELNTIKAEMALLKGKGDETLPSELMAMVLAAKPIGVVVNRFAFARTDTTFTVQLSGNANRPEELIQYRKLLKDNKDHVKDAKYSQSFINKKNDIDFQLTIDFK